MEQIGNSPQIFYPYVDKDFKSVSEKEGEQLEPRDSLGCCLGFCIFKYPMQGSPAKIDVKTKDEDVEIDWPPYLFILQLDGTLKWYHFFNT